MVDTSGNHTGHKEPAQNPAIINLREKFTEALDLTYWERTKAFSQRVMRYSDNDIARGIIDSRDPKKIIEAFETAKPEWKEPLSIIKKDPELSKALKNALVKDPTVLDGLAGMAADGNAASPSELSKILKDPAARKAMTATLNKIAEKPDDKYTFADFKELYDNRDNKLKTIAKLNQMGVPMTDMIGGDQIFSMLREALMSPDGFKKILSQLPTMMGLTGEQGAALQEVFSGLGNFMDMSFGTRTAGVRGILNQHGDAAYKGVKNLVERVSGQRDADIAKQMHEAGTGEAVDPRSKAAIDSSKADFSKVAKDSSYEKSPEIESAIDKFDREQVATRTQPHAQPGMGF